MATATPRLGHCAAKAAREGAARPETNGDLAYPLEADDLQVGIPEAAFLLGETCGDLIEPGFAARQDAIVIGPA